MSAHRLPIAALLAFLLTCGLVVSQINLPIPVNHTGTGTAIGANWPSGNGFNVWLFNAKDQPSTGLMRAYLHSGSVSASLTQDWMHTSVPEILTPPLYPSVITRGGMSLQQPPSWTEGVAAVHAPQRYAGRHSQTNWYWDDRTPLGATEPITCATTGRWEENASWNVVVGLDRIEDAVVDHYFERSPNGGVNWVPIPNVLSNVVPPHLAMTDVAIEDAEDPDKLVAVATPALNPVQGDELPLITGHVVSTRVCWTNNLRGEAPVWTTFDPAPEEELWNLQIALKNDVVYGLAYNATGDRQVLYSAAFVDDELVGWAPMDVNPEHPLPEAIPYDLEFVGNHSLLSTSEAGLYYSPNDGAEWYPATNFSADVIRTPELRRICVQIVEDDFPKIALAGWYASYVGKFDPETWGFDLREINYDPNVLDLYQNRNRAWSGLSLGMEGGRVDFALVDYSTDPYFPNDSAVVVQVDGPEMTPKNVFLGYQDHDTRPFMRMTAGTGLPWVVYEQQGTAGVVARTAVEPDYLTWDEVEIFNDLAGMVHRVLDAASCPRADYVVTELVEVFGNRLWERPSGQAGWIERAQGCPFEIDFIAPTSDEWLYLAQQRENNHLALSTDGGTTFDDITPDMHGDWSSISVGFDASMPLYGGTVDTNDTSESCGWIYRYDRNTGTWAEAEWDDGDITQIVADPYFKDVFFVACRTAAPDNVPMFQLGTYLAGEPAVFRRETLWKPASAVKQEDFAIRDIQIVPTSEHGREVCLTLRAPDFNAPGVDHTVVKRWQLDVSALDVRTPPTLNGEWIVRGM